MIWLNGRVHDTSLVPFDLRDRGLLLADGLFETILVVGRVPFRRAEHLARLLAGADVLRLTMDIGTVEQAVADLSRRLDGPGIIRVTVTRGPGARGLRIPRGQQPTVFATATPWSPALAFQTQHLAVSTIRRNDASPLSHVKSLAYLDNVLALEEALASGADDALLLSTRGRVTCTSAANVFILAGAELVTPPVDDGVLPGITRGLLLERAPACGLEPVERTLALADLHRADAVLATNSVRLISPVPSLDGQPLRCARPDTVRGLVQAVRDTIAAECGTPLPVA